MMHGVYQIVFGLTKNLRVKISGTLKINRQCSAYKWVQRFIVFVLVGFSWIFFRTASLSGGIAFIKGMCSQWNPQVLINGSLDMYISPIDRYLAVFGTAAMAVVGIIGKWKVIERVTKWKYIFWAALMIAIFIFMVIMTDTRNSTRRTSCIFHGRRGLRTRRVRRCAPYILMACARNGRALRPA